MTIQQQKEFLIQIAYWTLIIIAVYLAFDYLLPISVPFILGILIACLVVRITQKLRCSHKLLRISIAILIYGLIGLFVTLAFTQGIASISKILSWVPSVYEQKLLPFVTLCYDWILHRVTLMDPAIFSTLETLLEGLLSALKNLVGFLSGVAVNLVSSIATGVPSLILSILAMIFSTMFVVADFEQITSFASKHTPKTVKNILHNVRIYLTDTLFVVIRSYALIMLLTFTELSILFSLFGIGNSVLKAAIIALLDILPILGTGAVMIPWIIISFVLGSTTLGLKLLAIYAIVTVVRNYVEPKIVGAQLGLHPIITLVSMFIGLRLFGFWGLFGLPVGISFLWKQHRDKQTCISDDEKTDA